MDERKANLFLSKFERKFILQIILCIVLCLIVIVWFYTANFIIEKRKFKEYKIVDDNKLINSIEDIHIENGKVFLSGYAFLLNKNSLNSTISLFLLSQKTGKEIWFNVEQVIRPDVDEYFKCDYDYQNSGFIAYQNLNKLANDEIYEVIINIDFKENKKMDRKTVSTKRYLLNNELYTYNPSEFDQPINNIKSKLLREVFSNGIVCLYDKDAGMYVYQYQGYLYWVATKDFKFDESGSTYIIYQLFTTQYDKLPDYRIKHKYDNLDFYFEQYEYFDEDTSPYRVAIYKIPTDYSIAYIYTGVYDYINEKIIWQKAFHLNNILNLK